MKRIAFLLVILSCSLATAANTRITAENYNKIVPGASIAYVYGCLGRETGDYGSSNKKKKNLVWQDGRKIIRVQFENGKVVSKTQNGLK